MNDIVPSKLTMVIPTSTVKKKAYNMGKMGRIKKKAADADDDGSEGVLSATTTIGVTLIRTTAVRAVVGGGR